MYTKTTKNINITVNPYYLEDQSEPEDQHYVWAYQVTIDNQSKERVQLKNRYQKIIDSNGVEQEVRGEGVVGEQPILNQVETFLCHDEIHRKYVIDNISKLVVKPANASGGYGIMIGPKAPQKEREETIKKIKQKYPICLHILSYRMEWKFQTCLPFFH